MNYHDAKANHSKEPEERGFFRGSLKVVAVLGFLYFVGYLLSKGWGA